MRRMSSRVEQRLPDLANLPDRGTSNEAILDGIHVAQIETLTKLRELAPARRGGRHGK